MATPAFHTGSFTLPLEGPTGDSSGGRTKISNKDPATCYIAAAAAASVDGRLLHRLQPVLVPVERQFAVACKDSWPGSSCCTSPWPQRMRSQHVTGMHR